MRNKTILQVPYFAMLWKWHIHFNVSSTVECEHIYSYIYNYQNQEMLKAK